VLVLDYWTLIKLVSFVQVVNMSGPIRSINDQDLLQVGRAVRPGNELNVSDLGCRIPTEQVVLELQAVAPVFRVNSNSHVRLVRTTRPIRSYSSSRKDFVDLEALAVLIADH